MDSFGHWFMKIYDSYDDCGEFEGNAIRLDNGQKIIFDDIETVTKFKKDLTIDYSNDDITEWYED